ncbi:metallophosphoesterase [Limibaculum sp. FT325]|uniref:metallophosphoesterase n=1 Tax=Thermohalobaculum sediminis TaxID=2939436 RepID=UPI0020BE901B|nr:metallophosphoesterase [Limibaculum sediminis]MCL5777833.1 metallophosphoesterase [Limibaculum sediminis]
MVFGLIDRLKGRRAPAPIVSVPNVAGRIYAIGDVHGAAELLERMVARILAECRADGQRATLVMMGDYIDRGDSSRAALDLVASLDEAAELDPILLRGNHEAMLLDFIEGRASATRWLQFGGLQTLLSYGVGGLGAIGAGRGDAAERDLRAALTEAMGPHLGLLRGLASSHQSGNVLFAHAGAHPDLPFELQPERALIWGAPDFLDRPRADGRWVVHGHYVVDAPQAADSRIAIDTGAYFSQRLTAVRLDGGRLDFLTEALDG